MLSPVDFIDDFPSRVFSLTPDKPTLAIGRSSKKGSGEYCAAHDNAYIDSPVVSRQHAQFQIVGPNALYLVDLGSLHGTLVDNVRLKKDVPYACSSGAVVTFGSMVTHGLVTFPARSFRISCCWRPWSMPGTRSTFLSTTFAVPDESSEDEANYEPPVSFAGTGNILNQKSTFSSPVPQISTIGKNNAALQTPCSDNDISSSCAVTPSQAPMSAIGEPKGGQDASIDAQIRRLAVSQPKESLSEIHCTTRGVDLDSDLPKFNEETERPSVTGSASAIEAALGFDSKEKLRSVNLSSQDGETHREVEIESPQNRPLSDDAPIIDASKDDLKEPPVAIEDDKLEKHPVLSISHVLIASTERQPPKETLSADTDRSVNEISARDEGATSQANPSVSVLRKGDASGDLAHGVRSLDGTGKSTPEEPTEKSDAALSSSGNTCHRVFGGAEGVDTARDHTSPSIVSYDYANNRFTSSKSLELPASSSFPRILDEHLEQRATQQSPTLSFVGVDDLQARQYNSATAQWSPDGSMADDGFFPLPRSWETGQPRIPLYASRILSLPPLSVANKAVEGMEEHTTQAFRASWHKSDSMTSPTEASLGDSGPRTCYSSGGLTQHLQFESRFEQRSWSPGPFATCLGKRKHSEQMERSSYDAEEQDESSQCSDEVGEGDELPDAQATDSLLASEPASLNSFQVSQEPSDKSDSSPAPKRPRVTRSSSGYLGMVKSAARILTGAAFAGAGVFAYLAASNPDPI